MSLILHALDLALYQWCLWKADVIVFLDPQKYKGEVNRTLMLDEGDVEMSKLILKKEEEKRCLVRS